MRKIALAIVALAAFAVPVHAADVDADVNPNDPALGRVCAHSHAGWACLSWTVQD